MKLSFNVNDYILIWHLLFSSSVSEPIYKLKQKIWFTYKDEYNNTYKDKPQILKDVKNYIPNDDTVYNVMLEHREYQDIKTKVEKYRLEIVNLWNKKLSTSITKIIRKDIKDYTVYLVDNRLNILENPKISDTPSNIIILGKKIPQSNPMSLIFSIMELILKQELNTYTTTIDKKIADAIIEMSIRSELSQVAFNTTYQDPTDDLLSIKYQIYPYWLMYLGISKEDMTKRMIRDRISFDVEKFKYEKDLKNGDITDFIDFCIQNKKNIIREEQLELI